VAHLIELCTLVYPQKYGQPDSRPVPDYIKRLIAHNRATKKAASGKRLFDDHEVAAPTEDDEIIPDVEITEAEYRKHPLAADVKYWGHWVLKKAHSELHRFFPFDESGAIPVAYLWARYVMCPNPSCASTIPLLRNLWLCKQSKRHVAIRMTPDRKAKQCRFEIADGPRLDFDPNHGTMQKGSAACPFCHTVVDGKALRIESKAQRMGQKMITVVTARPKQKGKNYRIATAADEAVFESAEKALSEAIAAHGELIVPNEQLPHDRPAPNSRGLSAVVRYGWDRFASLFNARQLLTLSTLTRLTREAAAEVKSHQPVEYAIAIGTYLGVGVSRFSDFNSVLCTWNYTGGRGVGHTFTRQALPVVWDYPETSPFNSLGANWNASVEAAVDTIRLIGQSALGKPVRGNATGLAFESESIECFVTDPPYYDSVPYGDLSDFFYVWLKRALTDLHPELFRTPLTPKAQELIAYYGEGQRTVNKTPSWYEAGMGSAFAELFRVLDRNGTGVVMFAHKTTAAWEALIGGLLHSGLIVTASWPLHTERKARMVARNAAALASSVSLVCRKRHETAGSGLWDDVRQELKTVAQERLDFFWKQSIR
jgi:putative DNA methylase